MIELFLQEKHKIFRGYARKFVEREIIPHIEKWEENGEIPRSVWKRMGDLRFLGIEYQEEYGGINADFLFTFILMEELARCGAMGFPVSVAVHTDMASPYILSAGTEEQKKKYLPLITRGEKICAIAITEPSGYSDIAGGVSTSAVRKGDYYIINGTKMFIANGVSADIYIVAARTGTECTSHRHTNKDISLFIVERGTKGFNVGKKLKKIGWLCSDIAELSFDNCIVPASNLIGEEGNGFYEIMKNLQRERLVISIIALSASQKAFEETIAYAKERIVFGEPLSKKQAIRHAFASMATQLEAARQTVFARVILFNSRKKEKTDDKQIAMAKLFAIETANKIARDAMQIYGRYGYMRELAIDPKIIERFYRDARILMHVSLREGVKSEIMKEIVAKQLDL